MRIIDFEGRPNSAAPHAGPLTVDGTARTLLSLVTLHTDTRFVIISIEDADARTTENGTAPSSTLGKLLLQDSDRLLSRAQADALRLIRAAGTDAKIQVVQYIN
jgi:hypothetical protein